MKSYSSREVIEILEKNGWKLKNIRGDHYYFIHTVNNNKITVTHPVKDMTLNNIKSISKLTGIKF
ncbi:MAG: type II toxin-antitoxin system HicA family toxin [Clostridia bacterium]|nr:type II toxin-antitoxin system HicA family toxin [Clostridia bacterium]